jgi:hypothetical protein
MSSVPKPRPPRSSAPKRSVDAAVTTGQDGGRPGRILERGRAKAYRPLPPAERMRVIRAGLAAYRRGDYFLAHELLEPAWLGSPILAERDLLSGLIKLAAAYVHAVRGNPIGTFKNLRGARERLSRGSEAVGPAVPVDLASLLPAIDTRLRQLETALSRGRPAPRRALRAPRLRRPLGSGVESGRASGPDAAAGQPVGRAQRGRPRRPPRSGLGGAA